MCSTLRNVVKAFFIEREEIDAILKQSQGSLIGRKLELINLQDIEKKMKANPFPDRNVVDADEMGPGKAKAGKAKAGN